MPKVAHPKHRPSNRNDQAPGTVLPRLISMTERRARRLAGDRVGAIARAAASALNWRIRPNGEFVEVRPVARRLLRGVA